MKRHAAADLMGLLRARYAPGAGWAVLEQVRAQPKGEPERYADALVIGLWKTHRYQVIGVEIKVSRSDWLAEMRQPAKADALKRYCDRWYLVAADESIVRDGELPAGWGLLAPREVPGAGVRGTAVYDLVEVVPAPRLTPAPLDPAFVAGVVRRTVETYTLQGALLAAHARALRRVEKAADRLCSVLGFHDRYAESREIRRRLYAGQQGAYQEARAILARAEEEIDGAGAEASA